MHGNSSVNINSILDQVDEVIENLSSQYCIVSPSTNNISASSSTIPSRIQQSIDNCIHNIQNICDTNCNCITTMSDIQDWSDITGVLMEEDDNTNSKTIIDLDDELAQIDLDEDLVGTLEVKKDNDDTISSQDISSITLERVEIYSRHYKPTESEVATVQELANQLGIKGTSTTTSSSSTTNPLYPLLNLQPKDSPIGPSIVLKRGIVTIDGQRKELILMTHGMIVAKLPTKSSGFGLLLFSSTKYYEHVHFYSEVAWVKDMWQSSIDNHESSNSQSEQPQQPQQEYRGCFSLKLPTGELQLYCDSLEDQKHWLLAWERVLLTDRTSTSSEFRESWIIGWQHELVQTSLFTAAVTGQAFFADYHLTAVNTLDRYNGMAPLHYAALHNQVHIIEHLCADHGADVELLDAEGRTPMYYAQRDNWTPAIHILKQFGAKNSELLYREQHGALIEEARELESERQKQQQQQQLSNEMEQELQSTSPQQQQRPRRSTWLDVAGAALAGLDQEKLQPKEDVGTLASKAHSEMRDGLQSLQHRGNKVNELSDKTDVLENNANEFKRLAMEARKRLEKKNKGMNFLNPFAR